MNAAIEAAHAGETNTSSGAVVHSVEIVTGIEKEIKQSLADRTAKSTGIQKALKTINLITDEVHSGSAEMLDGSYSIISEITRLVDITEKVKNFIGIVADKAGQVQTLVEQAMGLMNENAGNTRKLNEQVSVFKIR